MGLAKLISNLHKRSGIPYMNTNVINHLRVSETSFKFLLTAKETQITRSHVDTDIVDNFSEFNCP